MATKIREWTEEFIELYRSEPCLWKIKQKEYHDRSKKEAAYAKLILKLQEIEPDADKESVVKKINNLRCTYKKELKKVITSKSGSGSEDIYEPKLWYFPLMTFLNDQDLPRQSRSNLDTDDNEINIEELSGTGIESESHSSEDPHSEDLIIPTITRSSSTDTTSTKSQSTKPLKRNSEAALTKDVLLSVQNHFKRPASQDDRYDIFGKGIALKLRDLEKTQRLLAEKIINEALFEAEMGNLTISHKVMAPTTTRFDEVYSRSSTPLSKASSSNYSNITQQSYSVNSSIPLHGSYPNNGAGYNELSIIQPQPVQLSYPTTIHQAINQQQATQGRVLMSLPNSPETASSYLSNFDSTN